MAKRYCKSEKKFRDLNKWELVAAHIKLDISGKQYFD